MKRSLYIYVVLVAIIGFALKATEPIRYVEPTRHFYNQGNFIHTFQPNIKSKKEQVTIHSQEDETGAHMLARRAVLLTYPNARANVVICHGFMCDKFDAGFVRNMFPKGQYNFISFDFRAHGELVKGQCCTFGKNEAYEVIAAANYFKNHSSLKKLPVFVYGFSMGAVASIEAQAKNPKLFDAMILDCPFDSTENIIKKMIHSLKLSIFGYEFQMPGRSYLEKYAFHPYVQEFIKLMLKTVPHMDSKNIQTYMYKFSPAESAKKITVPCLFIHCKEDQRVAINAIYTIYGNAQGPKQLWATNGRGHYDSIFYNPEKYSQRITKFYNSVITGQIHKLEKDRVYKDDDKDQVRFVQHSREHQ
jgi:hypothetical protein